MVDISLRVIYRPMVEKLPEVYRTLGLDYDERFHLVRISSLSSVTREVCFDRVLPSIVNEVLKSVVAQYNAIELIVKREQVWTDFRS